jgi:hypothetical protein
VRLISACSSTFWYRKRVQATDRPSGVRHVEHCSFGRSVELISDTRTLAGAKIVSGYEHHDQLRRPPIVHSHGVHRSSWTRRALSSGNAASPISPHFRSFIWDHPTRCVLDPTFVVAAPLYCHSSTSRFTVVLAVQPMSLECHIVRRCVTARCFGPCHQGQGSVV